MQPCDVVVQRVLSERPVHLPDALRPDWTLEAALGGCHSTRGPLQHRDVVVQSIFSMRLVQGQGVRPD